MTVPFLLGSDNIEVILVPKVISMEVIPSVDVKNESIHIGYIVSISIGNSTWEIPYNIKLTSGLMTIENYDLFKNKLRTELKLIEQKNTKFSGDEEFFFLCRDRHIAIPYFEIELKENFDALIHFLLVLDLNYYRQ